jgi:hypothetical protein
LHYGFDARSTAPGTATLELQRTVCVVPALLFAVGLLAVFQRRTFPFFVDFSTNRDEIWIFAGGPVSVDIDGTLRVRRAVHLAAGILALAPVALVVVDVGLDAVGTPQGGALVEMCLTRVILGTHRCTKIANDQRSSVKKRHELE